jgi:hypothetical protein
LGSVKDAGRRTQSFLLGLALWLSGLDVRGSHMFSGDEVTKIAANVVEAAAEFRSHELGISLMVYAFPARMA